MVDASSKRDIKENSVYPEEDFYMPRIYIKQEYCVSCACHHRIVRVRSVINRKQRTVTKKRKVSKSNVRQWKNCESAITRLKPRLRNHNDSNPKPLVSESIK